MHPFSVNKNGLKQLHVTITVHGLIFGKANIIGRIFASEIWKAYFWEGLLV